MAVRKNKKIIKILICFLIFFIWAVLSIVRTLDRNKDWFEPKQEEQEAQVERVYPDITEEQEFYYATAWCKADNCWALINIDGLAEFVLDEKYVEVTDFENTGYAIVKDIYGNKTVIDRTGTPVLYDNCYVCDKIISDNFNANMIIASKNVEENGQEKTLYGIIDATLNWAKAPSEDNAYLKEYTKGIDGGVFTTEKRDKLYFYTIDAIVDEVDEFLFFDAQTTMFRKGNEICLIDKSGENLRKDFDGVVKNGEWSEHSMYCEFENGKKQFVDINGKEILDVTEYNIINLPKMIGGYSGILMQTEFGPKFTVIDENGKFMFEPRSGSMCDCIGEKVFRIKYFNENQEEIIGVIDENGNLLFNVKNYITNFNNGYAVKDNETYVRTDGTELQIFKYISSESF